MSTGEVIKVLKIIRQKAKVPSVSFTGGEPLLRSDILRLTAEAVRIGLRVNLITNATCLPGTDLAENLAQAGLTSAQVSLEGPTADIHDHITDHPGSFDKTLAGLGLLREAGIHVHTNTTINTANVDHLSALVERVAELKLKRMSMNLIIPAGTARSRELQIPYHRIGAIVDRVRLAARKNNIEFMWYSPTPMCLYNPLAAGLGNKSCAACDGLLSVSPTGDVLPCSSYPEPVGNLFKQPFDQIWNNAKAKFLRSKSYAPAECSGCEDFTACAGACPLYWSAMGTEELSAIGRTCHAAS
jgi:radical SAM protein with 4Fe4S-binding SPASM domain